jgi:hypothetical protein
MKPTTALRAFALHPDIAARSKVSSVLSPA